MYSLYMQIGNEKLIAFGDQRRHCSECVSTSILDDQKFKSLYLNVYKFFKHINIIMKKDIPILFVDSTEMLRLVKMVRLPN